MKILFVFIALSFFGSCQYCYEGRKAGLFLVNDTGYPVAAKVDSILVTLPANSQFEMFSAVDKRIHLTAHSDSTNKDWDTLIYAPSCNPSSFVFQ